VPHVRPATGTAQRYVSAARPDGGVRAIEPVRVRSAVGDAAPRNHVSSAPWERSAPLKFSPASMQRIVAAASPWTGTGVSWSEPSLPMPS
jgi:hypothetical protein